MLSIVESFVKELTRNPEKVTVKYEDKGKIGLFFITVDPSDVGRVIGREGKIIKALDTFVTAIDAYNKKNYVLKINEGERNNG